MPSVEPGRDVVTAGTADESRAGAEGAQQESGMRRTFYCLRLLVFTRTE